MQEQLAASIAITTNNLALGIGAQPDGVSQLQGALDDVLLYNSALSASEIAALAGTPPANKPPVADFDGNGTTDLSVFRPSHGGWYVKEPRQQPADLGGTRRSLGARRLRRQRHHRHRRLQKREWYVKVLGQQPADLGRGRRRPRPRRLRRQRLHRHRRLQKRAVVRQGARQQPAGLGPGGDVPVPGDYDGNGTTDIAVFRNGQWYVKGQRPIPQIWGARRRHPRARRLRRQRHHRHRRLQKRAVVRQGPAATTRRSGAQAETSPSPATTTATAPPTSPSSETGSGTSRSSATTRRSGGRTATSRSLFPTRFAR